MWFGWSVPGVQQLSEGHLLVFIPRFQDNAMGGVGNFYRSADSAPTRQARPPRDANNTVADFSLVGSSARPCKSLPERLGSQLQILVRNDTSVWHSINS